MNKHLRLAIAVVLTGCAGGLTLNGAAGGVGAEPGSSTTRSSFDQRAFYAITTKVDGREVALTFVVPQGVEPGTLTTNPSRASVALLPLQGEPNQLWQLHPEDVAPGDAYLLYSKVSDNPPALTGILEVQNPDGEFSESPAYLESNNRVTVGYHQNENVEYWVIKARPGGGYRITSMLGTEGDRNPPGEHFPTRWNEERSLTAVKDASGAIVLRHQPPGDGPGQIWTFTSRGY